MKTEIKLAKEYGEKKYKITQNVNLWCFCTNTMLLSTCVVNRWISQISIFTRFWVLSSPYWWEYHRSQKLVGEGCHHSGFFLWQSRIPPWSWGSCCPSQRVPWSCDFSWTHSAMCSWSRLSPDLKWQVRIGKEKNSFNSLLSFQEWRWPGPKGKERGQQRGGGPSSKKWLCHHWPKYSMTYILETRQVFSGCVEAFEDVAKEKGNCVRAIPDNGKDY